MPYYCSEEEERLQRKLIPLNIVVCILCLVTIISLLVTPLIKFDVSKFDTEALTEFVGSDSSESEGLDFGAVLENIDGEISLTPIDLGEIAFTDGSHFKALVNTVFVKSGIAASVFVPMAQDLLLGQLGFDSGDNDTSALDAKFRALGNVHAPEAMRAAAESLIDEINDIAPDTFDESERAEVINMFEDMYNDTVAVTNGEFDLEKFICVAASQFLGAEEPFTDYTSFLVSFLDGDGSLSQATLAFGFELDFAVQLLAVILFALVAFTCFLWFVLFLFALFHTFAQNKRFVMWYVKLWGVYPCLLFGVLPAAGAAIFNLLGGMFASIGSVLGAISTFTWISGACYLLLWAFSIFWAFPIKRKIRADRKN